MKSLSLKKLKINFLILVVLLIPGISLTQEKNEYKAPAIETNNINIENVLLEDFELDIEEEENSFNLGESFNLIGKQQNYSYVKRKLLINPEDNLINFETNLIQLYFDIKWSPNITDNIKFYLRQTLYNKTSYIKTSYDNKTSKNEETKINTPFEAYLTWQSEDESWIVDLGKKTVKWGYGLIRNPIDILRKAYINPNNDTNRLEEEEGLRMLYIEKKLRNITLSGLLAEVRNHNPYKGENQFSLRTTYSENLWDLSVIYKNAYNQQPTYALGISALASDSLTLRFEFSGTKTRDRETAAQIPDLIHADQNIIIPKRFDYEKTEKDEIYQRYLLGGMYTFDNKARLILDYYHQTHGYDKEEWEKIEEGIMHSLENDKWAKTEPPYTSDRGNPYAGFLKKTLSIISNNDLRQNYLFLHLSSGETENQWELAQFIQWNLDDNSQIYQSSLRKVWDDTMQSEFKVTLFRGDKYSEYGLSPYSEIYSINLEYHL